MSVAKLRAFSTPDAMMPEQKTGKQEKEGKDSFGNIIRQAIGKESFLSFSRASENPIQWIQLLHALDQQGSGNKVPTNIGNAVEGKEQTLDHPNGLSSCVPKMNGVKEPIHSRKSNGVPEKVTKSSAEHVQTVKIPEAVVAFTQAAAKANGEPEKCRSREKEDLPGWPLSSPSKVQLQKCDKCSQEFCAPINYRRHIRVHRRSLNIDKVSPKGRDFLGAFWDKHSLDEAKQLVSFKDVVLEEVSGSSILRALTSFIRKPGFLSLPQAYAKAGSTLLDVVQARPSNFPISSEELFSLLDDASERTFLCAGTAISLQKFMFDGEVGKNALEMKNLIACISFLLEQKLVKAWLAIKDAEALRCQKLLVEEEEATQKRQAEILERRRLKKLRQKVQKVKEHIDGFKENSPDIVDGASCSGEALSSRASSETLNMREESVNSSPEFLEPTRSSDSNWEADLRCHIESEYTNQNGDCRTRQESGQRRLTLSPKKVAKPARNVLNGRHSGQPPVTKLAVVQKHNGYKDLKAPLLANGQKVWTRKNKPRSGEEFSNGRDREEVEALDGSGKIDTGELLIGTISVTLRDCNSSSWDVISPRQNKVAEKVVEPDCNLNSINRSTLKLWRPVSRHGNGASSTVQRDKKETKLDGLPNKEGNQILHCQSYLRPCSMGNEDSEMSNCSQTVLGNTDQSAPILFSSRVAELFLAQRWKEALSSDHVKLVLSPEMGVPDTCEVDGMEAPQPSSDYMGRRILGNAENRLAGFGSIQTAAAGVQKPKFKAKTEKSCRLKYIPKQRNKV